MKSISGMKTMWHEISIKVDITEEKVSELEDVIIKTIQNKTQKEKRLRTKIEYERYQMT